MATTTLDDEKQKWIARLERQAMEKMVRALCRHTDHLIRVAWSRHCLGSREADFQLQAYAERRKQAMEVLSDVAEEPHSLRISRLERLAEALDNSRAYFRAVR